MESWIQETYIKWERSSDSSPTERKDEKEIHPSSRTWQGGKYILFLLPLGWDQTSWDNVISIIWHLVVPCLASDAEKGNQSTVLFICPSCSLLLQCARLITIRMTSSQSTQQLLFLDWELWGRRTQCLFSAAAQCRYMINNLVCRYLGFWSSWSCLLCVDGDS